MPKTIYSVCDCRSLRSGSVISRFRSAFQEGCDTNKHTNDNEKHPGNIPQRFNESWALDHTNDRMIESEDMSSGAYRYEPNISELMLLRG